MCTYSKRYPIKILPCSKLVHAFYINTWKHLNILRRIENSGLMYTYDTIITVQKIAYAKKQEFVSFLYVDWWKLPSYAIFLLAFLPDADPLSFLRQSNIFYTWTVILLHRNENASHENLLKKRFLRTPSHLTFDQECHFNSSLNICLPIVQWLFHAFACFEWR